MDPYDVLGLAPDAPLDEAEGAYRRLLRVHHPDLHHDAAPHLVAGAERTTRALNAAVAELRARARTPELVGATAAGTSPSGGPWWARMPDDEAPTHQPTNDAPPSDRRTGAHCPMCGTQIPSAEVLRRHLAARHDLVLDRRLRPQEARRSPRRRPLVGLAFHSPWSLLPINAVGSLALAIVAGQVTHDVMVARGTFAVAMAPTVIRALARVRD